ncbi:MAG: hypothetical protein OXI15_02095 [Chromatiales bacterium]|nr:hypothetical protein [Chromatiales bacterium]
MTAKPDDPGIPPPRRLRFDEIALAAAIALGAYAALTIPFDTDRSTETFLLFATSMWIGTSIRPTRQLAALMLVTIALLRIL